MKCPHCNQQHDPGTQFCPVTGKQIPSEPTFRSSDTLIQTPDQIFKQPDFPASQPAQQTMIGKPPIEEGGVPMQRPPQVTGPAIVSTPQAVPVTPTSVQPSPTSAPPAPKQSSCISTGIILFLIGGCGLILILAVGAFIVFGRAGKLPFTLPFDIPGFPVAANASPTPFQTVLTETALSTEATPVELVVTDTQQPSATVTDTPVPSMTPSPTVSPTATPFCPGAVPQQITVGIRAKVCTKQDRLIVRTDPNLSAEVLLRLNTGTEFDVVGGPTCANNSSWWLIETDTGKTGWVREGQDEVDKYFICPVK